MKIEFDPEKNAKNIKDRNLSFELVADFEFDTALRIIDERQLYGEERRVETGYVYGRLHIVCYTRRKGAIRVISFRKANAREIKRYEEAKKSD